MIPFPFQVGQFGMALADTAIAQNLVFSSVGTSATNTITDSGRLWTVTSAAAATWNKARFASGKTSGKWYFEVLVEQQTDPLVDLAIGIATTGTVTTTSGNAGTSGRHQYFNDGQKRSGGTYAAYGAAFDSAEIIGCALDMDTKSVTMYRNGVSQGVMYTSSALTASDYEPHFCRYNSTATEVRVRAPLVLTYAPPAGYSVWT